MSNAHRVICISLITALALAEEPAPPPTPPAPATAASTPVLSPELEQRAEALLQATMAEQQSGNLRHRQARQQLARVEVLVLEGEAQVNANLPEAAMRTFCQAHEAMLALSAADGQLLGPPYSRMLQRLLSLGRLVQKQETPTETQAEAPAKPALELDLAPVLQPQTKASELMVHTDELGDVIDVRKFAAQPAQRIGITKEQWIHPRQWRQSLVAPQPRLTAPANLLAWAGNQPGTTLAPLPEALTQTWTALEGCDPTVRIEIPQSLSERVLVLATAVEFPTAGKFWMVLRSSRQACFLANERLVYHHTPEKPQAGDWVGGVSVVAGTNSFVWLAAPGQGQVQLSLLINNTPENPE